MAVRGDEVAGAIDAHVREGIEKMVGEMRSSIEDVREAVNSQLKAALQSMQADVNGLSFLPHIKKSIGGLGEAPAPVVAAPVAAANAGQLKHALQAVERGKSQVDVLNALLEQALAFGSRAALLILRGETFSGWKGIGFSDHGGNDESVKRFNAAPGLLPELDDVLRQERVVIWDGANLSTRLGVSASEKAVLVPMVIKDKVAAAVYVDAVGGDLSKLDIPALEILVFATGLLIDTLAIRKKIPSPSLTEAGDSAETVSSAPPPVVAAAPPPPPPRPVPAPRPAAAPAAPKPAAAAPAGGATVAISATQIRDALTAANPTPAPPQVRPVRPPVEIPRPASPPSALGGDERATTQYVPPSGVNRASAASTPATEETKKHDEARRFARLLVSEIKLYNEPKVDAGRKNKDLYERLKEDIDRSRQMYDERISEDVRKGSNYFYDELVRILADGDTGALGL